MKKHILSIVLLSFVIVTQIMAQCTPNTSNTKALDPDSAQGIPRGNANSPYSTIINLRVPVDTVYAGNHIPIDYAQVTSVTGWPAGGGFSYVCNLSNCKWVGGTYGCVLITGNPPLSLSNTSTLITVNVFVSVGSGLIQYNRAYHYFLNIDSPVGVISLTPAKFNVEQNSPNPFAFETEIPFTSSKAGNVEFKVFNMLGKTVFSTQIKADAGGNIYTFRQKDLEPGIYMYSVGTGTNAIIKRMVIARNQ